MAYLPILDILRSYFEIKEGDREFIIKKKMKEKILELDEKLKGVSRLSRNSYPSRWMMKHLSSSNPRKKGRRPLRPFGICMIRESQEKPLVMAVEDLHWIDRTSEEFLDYLIGWLANTRILLILLYRPEYTHQWGSKSYYTKIGLDQLGTQSSAELVKAILEEGEVAPELRELILNRAAGNPLFMEEFTHTLLENGSIREKRRAVCLKQKGLRNSGARHHPGDHRGPDGPAGGQSQADHAGGIGDRKGLCLSHPSDHHRDARRAQILSSQPSGAGVHL